jgi:hypothetical protein
MDRELRRRTRDPDVATRDEGSKPLDRDVTVFDTATREEGSKPRAPQEFVGQEFVEGQDVVYLDRMGEQIVAKIVRVDRSIRPFGYEIHIVSKGRYVYASSLLMCSLRLI